MSWDCCFGTMACKNTSVFAAHLIFPSDRLYRVVHSLLPAQQCSLTRSDHHIQLLCPWQNIQSIQFISDIAISQWPQVLLLLPFCKRPVLTWWQPCPDQLLASQQSSYAVISIIIMWYNADMFYYKVTTGTSWVKEYHSAGWAFTLSGHS